MDEPKWLTRRLIELIHDDQIAEHGGRYGIRDPELLDSALARPKQRWAYDRELDCPGLAASYGYGFARNPPFVDGNKRVALMAVYTFLGINGLDLDAPEPEAVIAIRELAAGNLTEDESAQWVRSNVVPLR